MSILTEKISFSAEAFYGRVSRIVKRESFFKTWFSRTSVSESENDEIVLHVPTSLSRDWIEKKYLAQISADAFELWGKKVVLGEALQSPSSLQRSNEETVHEKSVSAGSLSNAMNGVSPKRKDSEFSFEGFVTGPENLLAYTAAQGVATGSAHVHSPLFIVGGQGSGKTHLASCIDQAFPVSQVLCWHAEEFANAYIQAMQSGELDRFRAQIRSKRLFILEDLDFFLEGEKNKTKEELLHGLKVLKREHRQIVITSSEPASSFGASAPKLASFLLGGLTVKLDRVTKDSRCRMVEHYLKVFNCQISPKGVEFIQQISFKSPRELKGAIQQLAAYANLRDEKLPISVLKDVLSDHLRSSGRESLNQESKDLHAIAKAVSEAYGVGLQKLISPSRERYVSLARHVAMALSYDFHFTLKEIGQFYGGRLHQSVLHGVKRVGAKKEKDLEFQRGYLKLLDELKSSLKT